MQSKQSFWFTLVELIIVTAILAILWTIGFISYSNYLVWVRDTKRLSDLVVIHDGLQSAITNGDLSIPDSAITINAGWTLVWYQWYAGSSTLSLAWMQNGGKDPKNDTYYTYFLYKDMKSFELMAWLEDSPDKLKLTGYSNPLVWEAYAWTPDYSVRFPKVYGKQLWVLVDANKIPVQELMTWALDIGTTTNTYTSYLTDTTVITGTWGALIAWLPNGSCERISDTWNGNGDGIYRIDPQGNGGFDVWCDMTTDGGGWTLVGKWREWWTWSDVWQWSITSITDINNNEVHVMSSAVVASILWKNWKNSTDWIRIQRASLNQERRWKHTTQTNFLWSVLYSTTVQATLNGVSLGSWTNNDNNWGWSNNCQRIFLWAWGWHNSVMWWSAWASCCTWWWQYTNECHVQPLTRVYVRN